MSIKNESDLLQKGNGFFFVSCSQDLTAMLLLSERPSLTQTCVPLMSTKNAFQSKANCFLIKRTFYRENSDIKEYTSSHADKLTSRFTYSQNLSASCIQLKVLKLENGNDTD